MYVEDFCDRFPLFYSVESDNPLMEEVPFDYRPFFAIGFLLFDSVESDKPFMVDERDLRGVERHYYMHTER